MKIIKRVALCILISLILISAINSLYHTYISYVRNFDKDVDITFRVFIGVFSLFSLLFNLKKFTPFFNTQSFIYKFLRIGDLIFSISISIYIFYEILIGLPHLASKYFNREIETSIYLFKLFTVLAMLFLSIVFFLDNFKYHKEQKKKEALLKENDTEIITI